jgi:4-amino-4-deoxy-L-arabinose transferase-like glycosyltransferase
VLRLFTEPLVTQASWLLTLALLGIPLILVVTGRPWPLKRQHLALVLWAGWLLPVSAYLSLTTGLVHTYYLIMLGPPLAALVGACAWALWQAYQRRRWLGWTLVALLTGATLLFQIAVLQPYPAYAWQIGATAILLWLAGMGLLAWRGHAQYRQAAWALLLAGLVVAPLAWSVLTAFNPNPDVALPRAGPDTGQAQRPGTGALLSEPQAAILDYLLANTEPDSYLVATLDAHGASPYILATGRPVLTFGGFNGGDDVVDADKLAEMVASGELPFVLGGPELAQRKPEIGAWLRQHCTVVNLPGAEASRGTGAGFGPGRRPPTVLYNCGQ